MIHLLVGLTGLGLLFFLLAIFLEEGLIDRHEVTFDPMNLSTVPSV